MKNWGEKKACLTLVYLLFIIPVCNWPEQYYLCTKQLLRVCQRLAGNLSAALAGADCQNFPKKLAALSVRRYAKQMSSFIAAELHCTVGCD